MAKAATKKPTLRGSKGLTKREIANQISMINSLPKFKEDRMMLASVPDVASECQAVVQAASDGQSYVPDFQWMLPMNRQKIRKEIEISSRDRYNWRTNPQHYQELKEKLMASADITNREARMEMASYRRFELTSDLLATPFALSAFQSINLSNDELPMMVTPPARQYFDVRWIGNDGGARQAQWTRQSSATISDMRTLATDKVEYPLMDIQEGDINTSAMVDQELRFSMEMKIEDLARASMDAGIITSGLRDILNIHPRINQNNIPDSNYLDLTGAGYGTQGYLTMERLKAILYHISLWTAGVTSDGPFAMSSMIMSPQNRRDSWDYTDIVTGWDSSAKPWDMNGGTENRVGAGGYANPKNTVTKEQRDMIFSTGNHIASAFGFNWLNQYNSRLDRGRLYVTTTKPIGWYFQKTGMDKHIVWDGEPDNIEQNLGQAMYMKVLAFYMPELFAHHYLVVDF